MAVGMSRGRDMNVFSIMRAVIYVAAVSSHDAEREESQ